ncbi:MAG: isoprenylcysteine carboxylmethyltransferase family protein [Alphaproteobacteria bacterium]|jgi:protein-S-isoprenylcysteine O-methyltransferase Ste14|nr:isoprenylcysteine carboxylmethyltransferase family protein [Alphaproteobacteria bacterium]QQS58393.1 MAG: isoprenylcysteine carboxylmethyltransferase family protein [Alphaproteobacteria bacterium]
MQPLQSKDSAPKKKSVPSDYPDLELYWEKVQIPPDKDHPDVPILPPFLYAGALLFSLVFELFDGGDFFRWGAQLTLGILSMSLGAGIIAWCLVLFANEGTNIEPYLPTNALVTKGPYGYSRNPVYVGLTAMYIGLVIVFDIVWGFFFLLPLLAAVHFLVILREEEYLEEKFGQKYRDYQKSVRRWL